ncbi:GtrA family protein [Sesbania bispinosa]|nr:GtrA family protein [Sesbania bispinosa]
MATDITSATIIVGNSITILSRFGVLRQQHMSPTNNINPHAEAKACAQLK